MRSRRNKTHYDNRHAQREPDSKANTPQMIKKAKKGRTKVNQNPTQLLCLATAITSIKRSTVRISPIPNFVSPFSKDL